MKVVAPPYPTLELADLDPWRLLGTEDPDALKDVATQWDPSVSLGLCRSLRLDHDRVIEETALGAGSRIRVIACWRCDATRTRTRTCKRDVVLRMGEQEALELRIEIDGSHVASWVDLETAIVLMEAKDARSEAAEAKGATLWRDAVRVDLEDSSARFPVQWVDFGATRGFPQKAAWYLDWDPHQPDSSVLGGMRLYLNSGHTELKKATEGAEKHVRRMWQRIRLDVARQMMVGALQSREFMEDPGAFGGDTVGAIVRRLLGSVFSHRSPSAVRDLLATNPGRFEAQLQASLGYVEAGTEAGGAE
ncbi:MAG TPA: hypothetical protein RMH85_08810 [Polyangiaceae bacterium LLY-WYZ-15_(1-7)]|nr:hypothetical protein [Polyangiaceae bacterium LLY-WYZ-15_(1-7)]HJL01397.1 hypothetical protein [Polyangiaceae bacterium LLY-WYZ-15_(1-7)]HJL08584.1 hypothetical protein [Polyangiaceae bacterium LLY-WYZ-15_(1-7)]HJL24204.1 hypothetical protein [Polyangiaceae bacterium LLY-WYZ-15_(1-7)]HJL28485.1 hypothetical protein [Polyangiaceae bacterium LLY-WYZ-15_(1-7)]